MVKKKISKKNNLTITVNKNGFVVLDDFKRVLDIEKVVYYEVIPKEDGSAVMFFYDKNKKLVKPK